MQTYSDLQRYVHSGEHYSTEFPHLEATGEFPRDFFPAGEFPRGLYVWEFRTVHQGTKNCDHRSANLESEKVAQGHRVSYNRCPLIATDQEGLLDGGAW